MSLVVTSNVNISIDQVVTTTMSLVAKSNVNISIDQAVATTMSPVVRANVVISVDQALKPLLCHLYISANLLSTISTLVRGDSPSVHNPVAPSCLLRQVAPSCP